MATRKIIDTRSLCAVIGDSTSGITIDVAIGINGGRAEDSERFFVYDDDLSGTFAAIENRFGAGVAYRIARAAVVACTIPVDENCHHGN